MEDGATPSRQEAGPKSEASSGIELFVATRKRLRYSRKGQGDTDGRHIAYPSSNKRKEIDGPKIILLRSGAVETLRFTECLMGGSQDIKKVFNERGRRGANEHAAARIYKGEAYTSEGSPGSLPESH